MSLAMVFMFMPSGWLDTYGATSGASASAPKYLIDPTIDDETGQIYYYEHSNNAPVNSIGDQYGFGSLCIINPGTAIQPEEDGKCLLSNSNLLTPELKLSEGSSTKTLATITPNENGIYDLSSVEFDCEGDTSYIDENQEYTLSYQAAGKQYKTSFMIHSYIQYYYDAQLSENASEDFGNVNGALEFYATIPAFDNKTYDAKIQVSVEGEDGEWSLQDLPSEIPTSKYSITKQEDNGYNDMDDECEVYKVVLDDPRLSDVIVVFYEKYTDPETGEEFKGYNSKGVYFSYMLQDGDPDTSEIYYFNNKDYFYDYEDGIIRLSNGKPASIYTCEPPKIEDVSSISITVWQDTSLFGYKTSTGKFVIATDLTDKFSAEDPIEIKLCEGGGYLFNNVEVGEYTISYDKDDDGIEEGTFTLNVKMPDFVLSYDKYPENMEDLEIEVCVGKEFNVITTSSDLDGVDAELRVYNQGWEDVTKEFQIEPIESEQLSDYGIGDSPATQAFSVITSDDLKAGEYYFYIVDTDTGSEYGVNYYIYPGCADVDYSTLYYFDSDEYSAERGFVQVWNEECGWEFATPKNCKPVSLAKVGTINTPIWDSVGYFAYKNSAGYFVCAEDLDEAFTSKNGIEGTSQEGGWVSFDNIYDIGTYAISFDLNEPGEKGKAKGSFKLKVNYPTNSLSKNKQIDSVSDLEGYTYYHGDELIFITTDEYWNPDNEGEVEFHVITSDGEPADEYFTVQEITGEDLSQYGISKDKAVRAYVITPNADAPAGEYYTDLINVKDGYGIGYFFAILQDAGKVINSNVYYFSTDNYWVGDKDCLMPYEYDGEGFDSRVTTEDVPSPESLDNKNISLVPEFPLFIAACKTENGFYKAVDLGSSCTTPEGLVLSSREYGTVVSHFDKLGKYNVEYNNGTDSGSFTITMDLGATGVFKDVKASKDNYLRTLERMADKSNVYYVVSADEWVADAKLHIEGEYAEAIDVAGKEANITKTPYNIKLTSMNTKGASIDYGEDGAYSATMVYKLEIPKNAQLGDYLVKFVDANGEVLAKTSFTLVDHNYKTGLQEAIQAANELKEDVVTAKAAKEVPVGTFWVTEKVMNALEDAITAAQSAIDLDDSAKMVKADTALAKAMTAFSKQEGTAIAIDSIWIQEPESTTLAVKKKLQLDVHKLDADGEEATEALVWTSSDEDVAKVDQKGNVTGVGTGFCTITASNAKGDIFDSIEIDVYQPVTTLKPNVSKVSLATGATTTVEFVMSDKDRKANATWQIEADSYEDEYLTVGDPSFCADDKTQTIDVTANDKAVSSTKIVFKEMNTGKTVTVTFKIDKPANTVVNGMKNNQTEFFLVKDKNTTLKATAAIEENGVVSKTKPISTAVNWSSSDEDVVTVDQKGKVVAVGAGIATVTAQAEQGEGSVEYKFEVVNNILTAVKASSTKVNLAANDSAEITLAPQYKGETPTYEIEAVETPTKDGKTYLDVMLNGDNVSFEVNEDLKDEVFEQIKASGKNISTKVILKDKYSGKSVSVTVNIGLPANAVTTSAKATDVGLRIGKNTTLKATASIKNEDGTISKAKPISTVVKWKSSDESIATVNDKGKVTAITPGTCTITAIPEQGEGKLTFTVTVTAK